MKSQIYKGFGVFKIQNYSVSL